MKMAQKSFFLSPKKLSWKRKRSNTDEDVIIISSSDDEDDDDYKNENTNDGGDDVILISDSDDSSGSNDLHKVFAKAEKRTALEQKLTLFVKEVDDCNDSDDSDSLPNIFIKEEKQCVPEQKMTIVKKEEDDYNDIVNSDELPHVFTKAEKKSADHNSSEELGFKQHFEYFSDEGSWNSDISDDKPCLKTNDVEVEMIPSPGKNFSLNISNVSIDLQNVRRNMFNSIMTGSLRGINTICTLNPKLCADNHSRELISGSPVPTGLIFQSIIETEILNEEKLQCFALRLMLRTVGSKKYLNLTLANLLIKLLVGSSDFNVASFADFLIGITVLNKQLFYHPPHTHHMRKYYLKLCEDWFEKILEKTEEALLEEHVEEQETDRNGDKPYSETSCEFFDIANVAWQKEKEKEKKYLTKSKGEKLKRVTMLLKVFTDLFKNNTTVWLVKHWTIKCRPFRTDISPVLSQVTWKERNNFGCINQKVKKVFHLFSKSCEEPSLHELCRELISLYAIIIQRQENACIPYMGPISRNYAESLYFEIKGMPNVLETVSNLRPDWLQFQVISLKLGVVQPPNFFKVKEVIVKTLQDIQEGKFEGPATEEKMCFQAIRSMMGMLELKSSISPSCILQEEVMEDEFLWFRDSINLNSISESIKNIAIVLKSVEGKEEFFDGFESFVSS